MTSLVIRNGEIINAWGRRRADVWVVDGTIVAIGDDLDIPAGSEELDASGHFVMPGGIDAHTHLDMPFATTKSADDFYTGTAAALAGGTTSVIDFIIPNRDQSLIEARHDWFKRAEIAAADYGFHMALTWAGPQVEDEMRWVYEQDGISSFKVYMAYTGRIGVDDQELISLLNAAKRLGALVTAHCEHGHMVDALQAQLVAAGKTHLRYHPQSRPSWIEGEATNRFITLARAVDTPVGIVHLTCRESLEAVDRGRRAGHTVHVETCPQYLLLDDSVYEKPDFGGAPYVMSPPIRPKGHQDLLWNALAAGQIDTVATDHCPFTAEEKRWGVDDFTKVPNGGAGIQHRMHLMWTYGVAAGRITPEQFVDVTAYRPARVFRMAHKGRVEVGADADLILLDPTATGVIRGADDHHRVNESIFEGFALKGSVTHTIARGRVVFADGELRAERGAGRYVPRH